jgi:hypothetical protein
VLVLRRNNALKSWDWTSIFSLASWVATKMAKMAKLRRASSTGKFLCAEPTKTKAQHFYKGFVDGLGGATTLSGPKRIACRTYKGRGLKGDWIAVGNSIRRARAAG